MKWILLALVIQEKAKRGDRVNEGLTGASWLSAIHSTHSRLGVPWGSWRGSVVASSASHLHATVLTHHRVTGARNFAEHTFRSTAHSSWCMKNTLEFHWIVKSLSSYRFSKDPPCYKKYFYINKNMINFFNGYHNMLEHTSPPTKNLANIFEN